MKSLSEAVFPRRHPKELDEHLVGLVAPASFAAEQYRVLRYLIEQRRREASLQIVALTSPAPGDGKTTTAINLAATLAQTPEARVLLVDADVRRGAIASHLGLDGPGGGLVDAILDARLALGNVVRHLPPFNLSVLTAGRRPANPYEVLKSPRLGELLAHARQQYDYVVLDTPPIVPVPDARVIANWVDGFLLIVAAHRTPRELVEKALDVVPSAKLLGQVFNFDDRPLGGYHGYYEYYSGSSQSPNGHGSNWWRRVAIGASRRLWGRRSARS